MIITTNKVSGMEMDDAIMRAMEIMIAIIGANARERKNTE